jgi:hypothetical protein
MKYSISLLSLVAAVSLATLVTVTDITHQSIGTSVISSKSKIKGGDEYTVLIPADLSPKQANLLAMTYNIAKEDGNPHPEKLQGVLIQESKAGGLKSYKVAGQEFGNKDSEKYYGIFQMKVAAALDVLNKFPSLWRYMQTREKEEVIANLILNDEFAVRMASKYFLMVGGSTAYNLGSLGAKSVNPKDHHYTVEVDKYAKSDMIKQLNDQLKNAHGKIILVMNGEQSKRN